METNNNDIGKLKPEEMEKVSAGSDDIALNFHDGESIGNVMSRQETAIAAYCTSCGNKLIALLGGYFKCDCKTCSQFGKRVSSVNVIWH